MLKEITEHACAKINLTLDVVSKMPDGYHELCSVMQSVGHCDDVRISVSPGDGALTVTTNRGFLPTGEKNIAGKAALLFLRETGLHGWDIQIHIHKRIPVCAGLGGGSSDAAAVLRGLNTLLAANLSAERLEEIGLLIGADVPFCVGGGTRLAKGRGEILSPLPELPRCPVVLCKPDFSVSTPELFSKIDAEKIRCRPDSAGMIKAIEDGDLLGVSRRVFNVFEDVLKRGRDKIGGIKGVMTDAGALGAAMSGTGSAVFGLFGDSAKAETAYRKLREIYPESYLTETIKKGSIADN